MSVMVLSEQTLVKIKNSLVGAEIIENISKVDEFVCLKEWTKAIDEKYRNKIIYLHKLNVMNYCTRYKDHGEKCEFFDIDFDMTQSGFGIEDTLLQLESLKYNISDYFETKEIDRVIEDFKSFINKDYLK